MCDHQIRSDRTLIIPAGRFPLGYYGKAHIAACDRNVLGFFGVSVSALVVFFPMLQNQPFHVPTLTDHLQLWVVTERMKSWIQAAEMRWRVSRLKMEG